MIIATCATRDSKMKILEIITLNRTHNLLTAHSFIKPEGQEGAILKRQLVCIMETYCQPLLDHQNILIYLYTKSTHYVEWHISE